MRCTTWSTGSSCIGCSNQAVASNPAAINARRCTAETPERCEQAQRQDENQHTVRQMNSEIGQLEGKRIKAAEIMVERKAQLGNRSAGRPRTTAANARRQRLKRERLRASHSPLQECSANRRKKTGRADRASRRQAARTRQVLPEQQSQKFAQTPSKEKAPWRMPRGFTSNQTD